MKLLAVRAANRAAEAATDMAQLIELARFAEAVEFVNEVEHHARRVRELLTEETSE